MLDEAHRFGEVEDSRDTKCFFGVTTACSSDPKTFPIENGTGTRTLLFVVLGVDKAASKDQLLIMLSDLVFTPTPPRDARLALRLVRPIFVAIGANDGKVEACLLYTSPSPRDS